MADFYLHERGTTHPEHLLARSEEGIFAVGQNPISCEVSDAA